MNLRKTVATLGMLAVMGGSLLFATPAAHAQNASYYRDGNYGQRYYYSSTSYQNRYDNRDHNRDRESYRNAVERHYQEALDELRRVQNDSRLTDAVRSQLINRYVGILNYLNSVRNNYHYSW